MANLGEFNKLLDATSIFSNLSFNHQSISNYLNAQVAVVKNSAEQLVKGYSIYGLEFSNIGNILTDNIPGLNSPNTNLALPDPTKLVPQPEAGPSLQERITFYGHTPPQSSSTDAIVGSELPTVEGVGSVLACTPHPQHSYKLNSNRVINRTGKQRPDSGT